MTRHVLPLSVKHLDLPSQKHTNALVLSYLLQENAVELLQSGSIPDMLNAEHLIKVVNNIQPQPRVLLDVGAQILELNNYQLAEKWLGLCDPDTTKAIVFFNDDEELTVLD